MASSAQYQARPDPDQPWRYVCPDCDSHAIEIRRGKQRSDGFVGNYKLAGRDVQANSRKQYYCNLCTTRHAKVVDKKTGELADPMG